MAESDLMALPADAVDDVASRVGASLQGTADGTGLRVGIACAEFNGGITVRLLNGALDTLTGAGTDRRDVTVAWAPPIVTVGSVTSGSAVLNVDPFGAAGDVNPNPVP